MMHHENGKACRTGTNALSEQKSTRSGESQSNVSLSGASAWHISNKQRLVAGSLASSPTDSCATGSHPAHSSKKCLLSIGSHRQSRAQGVTQNPYAGG